MSLLSSIPLFRGLNAAELAILDAVVEEHQVAKDTVLFNQGDEADAVYVIAEGAVRIVQIEGTTERQLAVLRPGDFFGEMGVLEKAPRCAAAITDDVSKLLVIDKDDFLHLMAVNPHLSRTVMTAVTVRQSMPDEPPRDYVEAGIVKRKSEQSLATKTTEPGLAPVSAAPAPPTPPPAPAPPTPPPARAPGLCSGTIIGVFSSTGGVGTSLFSANLAAALNELSDQRVLVVDLDLMFGDQGQIFSIDSPVTMADLIGLKKLSQEAVRRCITESECGVHVLQAPKLPEHAEVLQPGTIISALELLRHDYDYIVCDTPHVIQEFNLNLLEMVQIPIYLMTPEVLSVKNAHKWFSVMRRISFPVEDVHLVFNKYEPGDHSSLDLIEENLGCHAFGSIPHDYGSAKGSLNLGNLIVRQAPQSPVGNGIRQVAGKLTGVRVPPPPEVPFWKRWIRV